MRLLECNNGGEFPSLAEFFGNDIPRYATLSHTWGADEVTFKDLLNGTGKSKVGYNKIQFCVEQATQDGIRYIWVDTCCIDKSNHNELTRAINSMFRWYQEAERCYVYLSDLSIRTQDGLSHHVEWESSLRNSRWFRRGWTLQELLAPKIVEFYSRDYIRLGDKKSLARQIHQITGIAIEALQGRPLSDYTVEERFIWAKERQTFEEEDMAYCLLGIFSIHLPLIYGEGQSSAMKRLRKEISDSAQNEPHSQNSEPPRIEPLECHSRTTSRESDLSELCHLPEYTRETAGPDVLFEATYNHRDGPICESCRSDKRVARPSHENEGTAPKNTKWQAFAAGTAVACAKEVLPVIPSTGVAKARTIDEVVSALDAPSYGLSRVAQSQAHARHKRRFRNGGRSTSREEQISRGLSKLLRHTAEVEGLLLRPDGYVNLYDVMNARSIKFLETTLPEIRNVVATSEKQRFSLIPITSELKAAAHPTAIAGAIDGDDPRNFLIRANRGHSIEVDL